MYLFEPLEYWIIWTFWFLNVLIINWELEAREPELYGDTGYQELRKDEI